MIKRMIWAAIALSLMGLASCGGSKDKEKKEVKPAIDVADMDQSVMPGEDFYQYSNGEWVRKAKIPADKARFGAFDVLAEENGELVKGILFEAMEHQNDTANMDLMKIGEFFASGMDTTEIEQAGLNPIKSDLMMIDQIETPADIVREIARERAIGGSDPFYIHVSQDEKDAKTMILNIVQSGLGMPDRDYYFSDDPSAEKLRVAYKKMLWEIFEQLGTPTEEAKEKAEAVYDLEKDLAEVSLTRLDYRNPHLIYNKLTSEELSKISPNIDWNTFFQNLGIEQPQNMIVDNPKFLTEVSKLIKSKPVALWKDYLSAHFAIAYAPYLDQKMQDISFNFYGKALSGQQVPQPRWKRVKAAVESAMGQAIGKIYVSKYFPPESKARMNALVQKLRETYSERIDSLTWMSPETKKAAQEKLSAIVVKIGYPDKWKDYADLEVSSDHYALNVRNGRIFKFNEMMAKLGKPVDRSEWFMTPQTVNAYYNPTLNEIVFPAGILQPPFFYPEADDAVNYGAIGVVIGHEITHGFDDQGRYYDKDGNLNTWWTEYDAEEFNQNAQLLVDQFDGFDVIDGNRVNGKLTLGENLADYGGLTISSNALKKVLAEQKAAGREVGKIDGFTPMQRFFIAYSKVWRNKTRPEELKRRLKEDVHSPGEFRVNGGVYNIDEFYQAFDVPESSPYYRTPEQRPKIW